MPAWLPNATEDQKARYRAAISEGQKRAWQKGRKGNYRRPRGRDAALYALGLPEGCARFYWLARTILGYHNPKWSSAEIIKDINWITRHYGTGTEGFVTWFKWLLGTHRIGQHEHMPPEYQDRLPAIEANYQAWADRLGW